MLSPEGVELQVGFTSRCHLWQHRPHSEEHAGGNRHACAANADQRLEPDSLRLFVIRQKNAGRLVEGAKAAQRPVRDDYNHNISEPLTTFSLMKHT